MVVVTGAAGPIGRRVLERFLTDPAVEQVIAVDVVAPKVGTARVTWQRAHLATAELGDVLDGADTLVHLAFDSRTERAARQAERANVEGTRRLLAAAAAAGVRHVVLLSSATVYGAWSDNPVPLTEDAPLRPNPGFEYAWQRSHMEQLVAEWAAAGGEAGRTAAVLRPCTALAPEGTGWLARALASAVGLRSSEDDPPRQFVHFDDVVTAVDLARRRHLHGAYNIAPDGWIVGERVRALAGRPARLRLPPRMAAASARLAWRLELGPIPPGLLPYTEHPWVVANDRLRAAGWSARYSNEAAFVAGTDAGWWETISPQRKQELALAAAGLALAGVAASMGLGVWYTVRRTRRTRRA